MDHPEAAVLWQEHHTLKTELKNIQQQLKSLTNRKQALQQSLDANRKKLHVHCKHDWERIPQFHGPSFFQCRHCGGWK